MGEKGGTDDKSHKSISTNYVNYKIVLTAIMTFLIGMVIVLIIVFYGMQISHKYDQARYAAKQSAPGVEKVIEIKYESDKYPYRADHEYSETDHEQSLIFEQLDVQTPYYVVQTQEQLEEVLAAITRLTGEDIDYAVEEGFFTSGSIIVAAAQDRGLSNADITGIYRDAIYNVGITIKKASPNDVIDYSGVVFLIKIPNIQPAQITVTVEDATPGV